MYGGRPCSFDCQNEPMLARSMHERMSATAAVHGLTECDRRRRWRGCAGYGGSVEHESRWLTYASSKDVDGARTARSVVALTAVGIHSARVARFSGCADHE